MVRIITGTENQIAEMEAERIRRECSEAERGRSVAGKEDLKGAAGASIEQRVAQLEQGVAALTKRLEAYSSTW